jgi:hypothetical protein
MFLWNIEVDHTMLILYPFYPHFFYNNDIDVKPTYSTHFLNFSIQMIGIMNHFWFDLSHFFRSSFSHY